MPATFNGTNQGTFSLMNVRNNAAIDTNIGNNVQIVGAAGTYALINLISGPTGTTDSFGNSDLGRSRTWRRFNHRRHLADPQLHKRHVDRQQCQLRADALLPG